MIFRPLCAAACLFALWFPASAADERLERETLRGIKQTFVLVETLNSHTAALGISEGALQSLAEVKIRLAGVRIIPPQERTSEPYVYIRVTSVGGAAVGFAVEVKLNQNAALQRDPGILAIGATTWSSTTVGVAGRNRSADQILKTVEEGLDEFLRALTYMNPK